MEIPSLVLRQLYTFGSLQNHNGGVRFSIKNRLTDVELTGLKEIAIGDEHIPAENITLTLDDGRTLRPSDISEDDPLAFPLRETMHVNVNGMKLGEGSYDLTIGYQAAGFGDLQFEVRDAIRRPQDENRARIPRDREDDYGEDAIAARHRFIEAFSEIELEHVPHYSFDPHTLQGNVESFVGVAQIPLGIAGPLHVKGEYAKGEFLVPLATTEGTLVASYNRGMKVLNLSGGVKCTVSDDCMQRAPVFIFESAREARDFKQWLADNTDPIRDAAESTTSVGKLLYIDTYLSNKFAFCRFNFSTGDAAGQNMVGRATFAACSWILDNNDTIRRFYLESNFATDKKASQVNIMRTRGKRVTAECTVKAEVLRQHMRVEPAGLYYHWGIAGAVGSILSGANNNGLHSPNGITAMFIATGQDVANVSESSAALLYCELTPEDDLYMSITIPSLIIATYGGGTGGATQQECLKMLGCAGKDKAKKLAEIIAGVVLAGEISLASAISSNDWVSSHEQYGRNR
ncbi:MAG: hydroxymethylglutaryl-CoA reductase [Bacteroidota bacterium]